MRGRCALHAQQPAKMPRLGVLLAGDRQPFLRLFGEGLRELGYIDGQTIQIEYRTADGKLDRLPDLAADLVRLKVDIIVASETPAVQAAKRATSEIPIVMAPSGDPVGTGLIASLSRPGGNVTGLSAATAELGGKSLDIIKEMLPTARRVAALVDPANPFSKSFVEHIQAAARTTGIENYDCPDSQSGGSGISFRRNESKPDRGRGRPADPAAGAGHRSAAKIPAAVGFRQ